MGTEEAVLGDQNFQARLALSSYSKKPEPPLSYLTAPELYQAPPTLLPLAAV